MDLLNRNNWPPARKAIAIAFAVQGLVFISLTTRLPRVQQRFDLSELAISGLLLVVVLMGGVGSVAAEQMSARRGSHTALRSGLALIGIGAAAIGLAPSPLLLALSLAVYGFGVGVVDAATNMQAVALEHQLDRPVLPSLHGAWTLGGLVATVITLTTTHLPLELTGPLLGLLPLVAMLGPLLDHGDRTVVEPISDDRGVPWRRIMLVGLAIVLFYMVDTASTTWGSLYFGHELAAPEHLVALATLPYLLASLVARLVGDHLTARLGAVRLLRGGALVAMAGLLVVVLAPSWPVGVLGFLVLGLGVAVIAPLSFSAAASIAREGLDGDDPSAVRARVDGVIARFNQFNYIGALLGAVLTGVVGQDNLRLGFAVPAVLVLGIWPLATAFAPKRAASSSDDRLAPSGT